jgi:5'-phosphate synthase pdxT subunit
MVAAENIARLHRPLGILALQGDFAAHGRVLDRLGRPWVEVRYPSEAEEVSGLVIPGGESTTISKLMTHGAFAEAIASVAGRGAPVYGSCAGAIMLAREVTGNSLPSLGLIDVRIERNAYGRQIDSFVAKTPCTELGPPDLEMVFIRAPIVRSVGPEVDVLASWSDNPVFLRQNNVMLTTFHPELSDDLRIHEMFVRLAIAAQGASAGSRAG